VAESLSVSLPELDVRLCGHGGVAELLRRLFHDNPLARDPTSPGFGWVMWDLAPIAWLIDPSWVQHDRVRSASVGADHRWQPGTGEITEAFRIDRKAVFADFFSRVQ